MAFHSLCVTECEKRGRFSFPIVSLWVTDLWLSAAFVWRNSKNVDVFLFLLGCLWVYRFVAFRCLCVTEFEKRGRFSFPIVGLMLYSCSFGDFAWLAWLLLLFVGFDLWAFLLCFLSVWCPWCYNFWVYCLRISLSAESDQPLLAPKGWTPRRFRCLRRFFCAARGFSFCSLRSLTPPSAQTYHKPP